VGGRASIVMVNKRYSYQGWLIYRTRSVIAIIGRPWLKPEKELSWFQGMNIKGTD